MKVGVFLFYLLTLLQGFGNQTNSPIDSTNHWLKLVRTDENLDLKKKDSLLKKALQASLASKPSSLLSISSAALGSGDSSLFRKYNKQVIELTSKLREGKSHAFAHWDLADFLKKTVPDSAFYHYQEAYNVFQNMNLDETTNHYPGRLLIAIGNLQDNIKNYTESEKSNIKAIEYLEKVKRPDQLYYAYNGLGIAQNGMKKFDKAIEYYLKAKEYIIQMPRGKHFRSYLTNKNNIASAYLRKGDFAKSFELYSILKGRDSLLLRNPGLYAKVISGWGYAGFKSNLSEFEESEKAFEKSNKILDSLGDEYSKARNYEYHAQVLTGKNDTLGAIKKALIAKAIADETMNNDRLLSSLKLLTSLDKKNSANYAKAYFDLTEELQDKERTIQDKFARIRMKTDEIIEENESLAKQKELYAGIALILLVLGIGIFTIVSQRVNNEKLKFNQKQQESNHEIYNLMLSQHGKLEEGKKSEKKRISEELHDGVLGQMLGIRLILSGLNERNDKAAIEQRAELIQKLQELEEEVRTISHELNESAYEKVHEFMLSIQELISNVQKSTNATIKFDYMQNFSWDTLNGNTKINIYRIIQECLQNSIKHSKCKNINVSFKSSEKMLNLTVTDDGIGFESNKEKKGIGLKNIISRVKKIDGLLRIDSIPGKGTKINIEFSGIVAERKNPKPYSSRKTIQEQV